ncbi:MAG TPA: zinc ABC transporter substrate-binding protein [Thermoanaerobaculia bacterium]|nr:zinc ABC transporter substrate-binding protein [Thermoanaerobaculia bacterium]
MSKFRLSPLVILPFALALAACGGGEDASAGGGSKPLRVVATTSIIADTASRIAGEHVKIEALMGPGVDPHLYKASESDVRRLSEADLVLYNGLHLEGKMGDILKKMARSRPVIAVSDDIPPALLRTPPEFKGQHDPHVWFDVSMWKETLGPITRELSKLDPGHAKDYEANAAAYGRELDELDAWVKQQIATLPPNQKTLVTAHDAFGYFGRRYGLDVVGIQGISTLSEAGLNDMDRVVQIIVDRKVKAIFVESSVPRRSIEAVQAGVEARGHQVAIGGQLYSDSLGAAGAPEGTYVGMVRANTNTIVNALK